MTVLVPAESIVSKIVLLRGEKILIDRYLAELYGVETKQLKRAVRRHINRFPKDFMFQLTREEYQSLRSQFGTLNHNNPRHATRNLQRGSLSALNLEPGFTCVLHQRPHEH